MKRTVKKLAHTVSPKRIVKKRQDKSIILSFAERHGLVYFGGGAAADEYRMVHGLTLSTSHSDLHYCIGTYEGYDVAFVERSNMLRPTRTATAKRHKWHIFSFDLIEAKEIPHVFVGLHSHSESFYTQLFTKYPKLRPITLGAISQYSPEFIDKYRVYTEPQNAIYVEHLISPLVSEMVSRHFGSLAIEIKGSTLYVYAEHHTLSGQLLEAMIKNGRWLADHIDRLFVR